MNKLYDGSVELEFNEARHLYTVDGLRASGVTTALGVLDKPALVWWSAKMAGEYVANNIEPGVALDEEEIAQLSYDAIRHHRSVKDSSADTGTKIHEWIEEYIQGNNPPIFKSEKMRKSCNSFIEWWSNLKIGDFVPEQRLYSVKHNLAGTADFVGMMDDKLTIADWKTGSGIYDTHLYQMGAYAMMYEEEFGKPIEQVVVVNCSTKGHFETKTYTDVQRLINMYVKVLEVYKLKKEFEKEF